MYKPAAAIKGSIALHAGAAIGVGAGLAWPWAVGGLLLNHAVLTAAGLWPRSTLLGRNMTTLPTAARAAGHVAITIDDGPHPDITPQVLDMLDAAKAKATFFCIGQAVEAHPLLAREIVQRGHRIENHSYAHRHDFSAMGLNGLRREIVRGQNAIAQITGTTPQYFRAPAGLRSPLLDSVLQSLSLDLVSWTRRGFDTVTHDPVKVRQRLEKNLAAGDILLLHDGHCALTDDGIPVVLAVLPKLLQTLHCQHLTATCLPQANDKTT